MTKWQNGEWRQWLVPVLLILLLISLSLHFWTLATLARLRAIARQQLVDLSQQVAQLERDVIEINVDIDREVPIRARIPVQQQLMVPIDTTIDLNQAAQATLNGRAVAIPIDLVIPIRTTVPITIDETVEVSTTVDLELTAPLSVSISETSLAGYLRGLQQSLLDLREQL